MVEESTSSVPVPPNVLLAKFVPNTIEREEEGGHAGTQA